MSCECYKIGGPWITYDPQCPVHGDEAQRREADQEEKNDLVLTLAEDLHNLKMLVLELNDKIEILIKNKGE